MNEIYRFRTNWRGQLILQRKIIKKVYCSYSYDEREYVVWEDASAEDLGHYFGLVSNE